MILETALVLLAFGAGHAVSRRMSRAGPALPATPEAPAAVVPEPGVLALASVVGDAMLILDARDRVAAANPAALADLVPAGEVLGVDAAVLVRSADFVEGLRCRRADMAAAIVTGEVVLRRGPRAPERVFLARYGALPESAGFGPGAVAVVFTEVTRVRRLEAVRREFVANVSHDLRTPVTIIKGYAQALAEDYAAMADEDRIRFVEKIHRNTERMHALLESLLELARAEGDAGPELRCGVLHRAIEDAVDMLSDRLASAGITVSFDLAADDTAIAADAESMARIVRNLLENTLRYATGATRVSLTTAPAAETGGCELRVADDGPGVPEVEYAHVFRRFYRTEKSRSQAHGGLGLGLSLVKSLVKAHGGDVRAEPVRPHGFCVVITLPRAAGDGAGAAE